LLLFHKFHKRLPRTFTVAPLLNTNPFHLNDPTRHDNMMRATFPAILCFVCAHAAKTKPYLRQPKSTTSTTVFDDQHHITKPCTLILREMNVMNEHGDIVEEFAWDCELDAADTKTGSKSEFIELDDAPFKHYETSIQDGGLIESGVTTMYLGDVKSEQGRVRVESEPILGRNTAKDHQLSTPEYGEKSVLAVRVTAVDAENTFTAAHLSDKVFGTDGSTFNLVSGYKDCSQNKLRFAPATGSKIQNGVYDVKIPDTINGASRYTVVESIKSQLTEQFGDLSSQFDKVMICVPPGTAGDWITYAYNNHWLSVYNDEWCTFPSVQMHEIGNNLNLANSDVNDDQTDMMGYSYGDDDGPHMSTLCPMDLIVDYSASF